MSSKMEDLIKHGYHMVFENIWKSVVIGGLTLYIVPKIPKVVDTLPLMLLPFYAPKEKKIENYEKDVVYMYHWPHKWTRQVPNMSPYSIKLETWMRLKKIRYEIVETMKQSPVTKQIPYIRLNGEEVAESSNIIQYLAEYFKVDITDGLSPEQCGIGRAFYKMIEDSTAWTIFLERYVYKPHLYAKVTRIVDPEWLSAKFIVRASAQGIGRQSKEFVQNVGKGDIKAVSDFLGKKKFLFGDQITLADCAVFGHLCQVAFVDFEYFHKEALADNVVSYLERIRDTLWPDWHQRAA